MPSYYEALPIYKVAMDVAVRVDAVVQRFAKGHKYTLGGRLRETTLDVVMLIARLIELNEGSRSDSPSGWPLKSQRLAATSNGVAWPTFSSVNRRNPNECPSCPFSRSRRVGDRRLH